MSMNQTDLQNNGKVKLLKEMWERRTQTENTPAPKSRPKVSGDGGGNAPRGGPPQRKPPLPPTTVNAEEEGPEEDTQALGEVPEAPQLPESLAPKTSYRERREQELLELRRNMPLPPLPKEAAEGGVQSSNGVNATALKWRGARDKLELPVPRPTATPVKKRKGGIKGFFSSLGRKIDRTFKGKRRTPAVPENGVAEESSEESTESAQEEAPKEVGVDQVQAPEEDKPGVNEQGQQLYRVNGALYTLGKQVGAGGSGAVFLLVPENPTDKPLVVKMSNRTLAKPEDLDRREESKNEFENEAKKFEKVQGASKIMQGFGLQNFKVEGKGDQLGLIMESMPNGELAEMYKYLRAAYFSNKISYVEYTGATQYMQKGAYEAIAQLEKMGLVHMDVKPQNMMFDHEYNVKLIDIGSLQQEGGRKVPPKAKEGEEQQHPEWVGTTGMYESPEYRKRAHFKGDARTEYENRTMNTKYDAFSAGMMGRANMLGPVESAPEVQKRSRDKSGVETSKSQQFESSATRFAKSTTEEDSSKRLLASQALKQKFLADPLLQDDQAKKVLQKVKAMKPQLEEEAHKKKELEAYNARMNEYSDSAANDFWKNRYVLRTE